MRVQEIIKNMRSYPDNKTKILSNLDELEILLKEPKKDNKKQKKAKKGKK